MDTNTTNNILIITYFILAIPLFYLFFIKKNQK